MKLGLHLGLTRQTGASVHDGVTADFVAGRFAVKPPGGPATNFGGAQAMFAWSSSAKWTRNAAGILVSSGANAPAYEWDASGGPLGVRVEGARTNVCLWSDDMSNAVWTKTNATAAKTATGADGAANTASKLTASAANATILQAFTSASATRHFGAWIRRRSGSGPIHMTVDAGTTWTPVTPAAAWQPFGVNQAAVTDPVVGFRIAEAGDEIDVQYCQLENAASFGSSPIPTTTASVTRNADTITMAAGGEWNPVEGTLSIESAALGSTALAMHASVDDGSSTNAIWLYTGGDRVVQVRGSGNNQVASVFGIVLGQFYKSAVSFKVGDCDFASAGALAANNAAAAVPGVTTYRIGTRNAGLDPLFGYLKSFEYWPVKFTRPQLQALTA